MFKSGECGNLNGRPKGSGYRQRLYRELIAPKSEDIINTALEMAVNGNETLLKFFLDRILPKNLLSNDLDIQGNNANEIITKLLAYVATGDMTADEAHKIAAIVHKDAEINNQILMIDKLNQLEDRLNSANKQDINLNMETNNKQ